MNKTLPWTPHSEIFFNMKTGKYRNKYRIPSARLQSWDYGWKAAYFITICTRGRLHYFGEIENKQMILNKIGIIAQKEWIKTADIRLDMNLKFGEFVIMPNHLHGIIIIRKNLFNTPGERGNEHRNSIHRTSATLPDTPSTGSIHTPKNFFGPQSKNLASIVRGFKSAVTIQARQINPHFGWQPKFHDHIIHDMESFERISQYIANNPRNWENDKFFGPAWI
jgi:REP element-mobilizing transposase RayT